LGSNESGRAGPGGIGIGDKTILGEQNTEGDMNNNIEGKAVVITGMSSGLGEAGSRNQPAGVNEILFRSTRQEL
jgi:hypothetical protein